MKVYDTLRMLNHLLSTSCNLNLKQFVLRPESLRSLPARWKRVWSGERWYRKLLGHGLDRSEAELPDEILQRLASLRGLFLTMDQAAWGWSAGHFLLHPQGFSCFGDIRAAWLRRMILRWWFFVKRLLCVQRSSS